MALAGRIKSDSNVDTRRVARAFKKMSFRVELDRMSKRERVHLVRELFAEYVGCVAFNGQPCAEHAGVVHGGEAEELRAGVEAIIAGADDSVDRDARVVAVADLQDLLDRVDARDSLAFVEARAKRRGSRGVTKTVEEAGDARKP